MAKKQRSYCVVVDHSKTVKQLLSEGQYNRWEHMIAREDQPHKEDVTDENFPMKISKKMEKIKFVLLHLGYDASTESVLSELQHRGLRPATNRELLAFGLAFPIVQEKLCVVELGSTCRPDDAPFESVSCLCRDKKVKIFATFMNWGEYDCFLAVRKKARKKPTKKEMS